MFFLAKPGEKQIRARFRTKASGRHRFDPALHMADHNRVELGRGEPIFRRAARSIREWRMFDIGWVTVHPPGARIKERAVVGVVVYHVGFWSVNPARILETIDQPRRFGFTYGTLPGHAEEGEERFLVEWLDDDSVWYDLRAFSRPNHWLAWLGYPLTRLLQKRFARDSLKAMLRARESYLQSPLAK